MLIRTMQMPFVARVGKREFCDSDRLQGEHLVQDTTVQLEDCGVSDTQTGFVSIRPTLDLDL